MRAFLVPTMSKFEVAVDAAHKLGRQAMFWAQLWFYWYCVNNDIAITTELVAGVSGCAAVYTAIKGKGRQ